MLALALLQSLVSCKGQDKADAYVQQLEFGYKGPLTEVTSYMCAAKDGSTAADTTSAMGKIVTKFDGLGNVTAIDKEWNFGENGRSQFSSLYFGKGQDISFQEKSRFNDGETHEIKYRYVWSDSYNYKIVAPEEDRFVTVITLDDKFRLAESLLMTGKILDYVF